MVSAYDFMPKYVFLNLQWNRNHDFKCLNEKLQKDVYLSTVLQVI